jgi:hypothetical protein
VSLEGLLTAFDYNLVASCDSRVPGEVNLFLVS